MSTKTKLCNLPEYVLGFPETEVIGTDNYSGTMMKYLHREADYIESVHDTYSCLDGALIFGTIFSASEYIRKMSKLNHSYIDLTNKELKMLDVYRIQTRHVGKSKQFADIVEIENQILELQEHVAKLYYNPQI
jgi:hypothetical protein